MSEQPRFRLVGVIALTAAPGVSPGCSEDGPGMIGPNPGDVEVTTATTGRDLDPDGYALSVDGGAGPAIGVNSTVTISGLGTGNHELELTGVAANCTVLGSNPRSVTVPSAGLVRTSFQVSCATRMELVIASGNDQQGKVGALLAEPFVVRVTDAQGVGLAGVEVVWGSGDGAFEGQFDDDGQPVSEASTRTNAEGLAEVFFMPTSFRIVNAWAFLDADEIISEVSFSADARDPGAALAIVSGNDQPAKAGQQLAEPFVVRVTDGQGIGVPNVPVYWRITFGDGVFEPDESHNPLSATRNRTDADGLAQVSFMPTWFGPVEVEAGDVIGVQGSPAIFTADATDLDAGLAIVAGNDQIGKAGEPLSEPFVVRVTDGQGLAVPNVRVDWSGRGSTCPISRSDRPCYYELDFSYGTTSDSDGLAQVSFSPSSVGTSEVTARPAGLAVNARVSFTAETTVLVIALVDDSYYGLPTFMGPYCFCDSNWIPPSCSDGFVPVGTPVELVNYRSTARIVSTSAPAGGASFDSGTLSENGRFQFVPRVVGVWEYTDEISGVTGTLTAY